jgi:hypothetical protein
MAADHPISGIQRVDTRRLYGSLTQLRLMIHPVVLGTGERLVGEASDEKPLRLLGTRAVDGNRLPQLRDRPGR